jgi:uncharacterized membrane protein YbhN (UPF0104 family)
VVESPAGPPEAAVAESAGGFDRLGRGLAITGLLGVLACVGLVLVGDAQAVGSHLARFDRGLLVPILALSLANYALRFVRWQVYLKALDIELPWTRSLGVFLVGFVLSVTPGKAGELGKAWLVRELGGGRALRVVPAVLAERVTDLLGVIVLLSCGALPFPGGPWIAAGGLAAVAAMVAVLTWETGAKLLFRQLGRLPRVGRFAGHLLEVVGTLRALLSPGLLALGLAVAVLAWGAEGIGFWLAVRAVAPDAGLLAAVFNYNLGTVIGSLSMLPGGLLAAEGALTAVLHAQGLSTAAASSTTLITRAATLWFAVLLGLLALPFVTRWLAAGRRAQISPRAASSSLR